MLGYYPETYIRAHSDVKAHYYNHSYDRRVRGAYCKSCDTLIGEQQMYPDFETEFKFVDREYGKFKFCPYCGKKLFK